MYLVLERSEFGQDVDALLSVMQAKRNSKKILRRLVSGSEKLQNYTALASKVNVHTKFGLNHVQLTDYSKRVNRTFNNCRFPRFIGLEFRPEMRRYQT